MGRDAQSTQNNNCNILQFCEKEAKNCFDILHEENHQSFLQADTFCFPKLTDVRPYFLNHLVSSNPVVASSQ